MNKYEIRTQQKKESIVSSALELFAQKGYVHVSIKEIAESAHVSQVSIYNYYGSKELLASACLERFMDDILSNARKYLTMEMDYYEKVLKVFSFCNDTLKDSLERFFTEASLNDESFMKLIKIQLAAERNKVYCDYIELGRKEGVISDALTTETILELIGAINNVSFESLTTEEAMKRQMELQHLALFGIIGK